MADARAFTEVAPEAYSHEIDVNLKGVLNGTKAVIGDMTAEELAEVVLYCWKLPPTICIRDIVVAPTKSGF